MNQMEEFIKEHCRDYGTYPMVFDKNIGLDITIPNHPELKVAPPREYKAVIKITTFRGTCYEAVHYYGDIEASGPHLTIQEEDGSVMSIGGYVCEEYQKMSRDKKALIDGRYRIEILRGVTQKEIDDDPDRWYGYDPGDSTNAFYSKSEIFAIAKKIIEYRFPGWEIELDDCC
jgi:hypothetical protein